MSESTRTSREMDDLLDTREIARFVANSFGEAKGEAHQIFAAEPTTCACDPDTIVCTMACPTTSAALNE